jgi:Kef-type K+ transport system membrane component KefB
VRRIVWTAGGYGAMLALAIGGFLWIGNAGGALTAPPPGTALPVATPTHHSDVILRVLIALAAIIITGRILAKCFALIRQPTVIGEVAAGILLGPSFLGPQLSSLVLPPSVAPMLGVIAQLGVILYMFLVGLEFNPALLRNRAQATVLTSHASILVPFMLGALLALHLYPRLSHSDVPFIHFALFMGVAMSITAFPVLARLLTDYRLTRTSLGAIALSCAAVDDVTAWCLLAFAVGIAKARMSEGLFVAAGALIFIAFMLLTGRPFLAWMTRRWDSERDSRTLVTLIFIALLLAAISAEVIGIHAIFGAFLLGAVIPHDSAAARALSRQLESVVTVLLLPAFFALTGMRTRIDLLSDGGHWILCGLIIVTATIGKFGGTFAAARLTGLRWRNAALLGALMNTRGLMELIILNIGLDLHIISPTLFAMMVIMALATTALTSPVLYHLKAQSVSEQESAATAEAETEHEAAI